MSTARTVTNTIMMIAHPSCIAVPSWARVEPAFVLQPHLFCDKKTFLFFYDAHCSSIWIWWSKKDVQPSLPYRQSSSGLLWCCRKKSNEWTIWYVEYNQNMSEVLLLKPEGAKWKILYLSFICFSSINQNLGKLKLVEYKLFSKTPSGQNPSNPGVGNVSMSALIRPRGVKLLV